MLDQALKTLLATSNAVTLDQLNCNHIHYWHLWCNILYLLVEEVILAWQHAMYQCIITDLWKKNTNKHLKWNCSVKRSACAGKWCWLAGNDCCLTPWIRANTLHTLYFSNNCIFLIICVFQMLYFSDCTFFLNGACRKWLLLDTINIFYTFFLQNFVFFPTYILRTFCTYLMPTHCICHIFYLPFPDSKTN